MEWWPPARKQEGLGSWRQKGDGEWKKRREETEKGGGEERGGSDLTPSPSPLHPVVLPALFQPSQATSGVCPPLFPLHPDFPGWLEALCASKTLDIQRDCQDLQAPAAVVRIGRWDPRYEPLSPEKPRQ